MISVADGFHIHRREAPGSPQGELKAWATPLPSRGLKMEEAVIVSVPVVKLSQHKSICHFSVNFTHKGPPPR